MTETSLTEAPTVQPLDASGVRAVAVGTVIWALAFIAVLPFQGRLEHHDLAWLPWTCLAGVGLGLVGVAVLRRRVARVSTDGR